jgi:hypothetical protein
MHFIEQLFGIVPDGGNGLLEVVLITLPLVVSLLVVPVVALRQRRTSAGNGP